MPFGSGRDRAMFTEFAVDDMTRAITGSDEVIQERKRVIRQVVEDKMREAEGEIMAKFDTTPNRFDRNAVSTADAPGPGNGAPTRRTRTGGRG